MSNDNINNTGDRPPLTRTITVEDFRQYYWLKTELEDFCRRYGISTSGGKIEIARRIESFLQTGRVPQARTSSTTRRSSSSGPTVLTLETVIHEGFVCTQRHREFFKSVIGPTFHFSTFIQNYFKDHVGQTYRDAVNAWHQEEERKQNPSYQTNIAPQFEYNQFIRDFFNDPKNRGKTRQDAIRAWKIKRSRPGDNRYSSDDTYDE